MKIDPADMSIISSHLLSVATEMADTLQRAAYSTIVRESKDYSTCVMDANGNMVAQSELIAMHMNSLASVMDFSRKKFNFESIKEGDILITNNPYENGQHLNDLIIIMPVFSEGLRVAFVGTVCHHLEVGGSVAGSNVNAKELYHEGLVIPLLLVDMNRDLEGGLLATLLSANVRIPTVVLGDLSAQISALKKGNELVRGLFKRYGRALTATAMREFQDYAEIQMRRLIRTLPNGVYSGADAFDGKNHLVPPVWIRAKVIIEDDIAKVDLSGSDDQVEWPVNAPVASTHAAVLTVFAMLLGPGVPVNAGTFRPITIYTRKGSVLDPLHPAPVRARMTSAYRAYSAVKRALSGATPVSLTASGNDSANLVTMSRKTTGGYAMFMESISGGNGAWADGDGESSVSQALSNTSNTPVESIELKFPFVRIVSYSLAVDSGGAGQYRGGLGATREYEILDNDVLLSTNGDHHKTVPWGLAGGVSPPPSALILYRDGAYKRLEAASNIPLLKGDRLRITICGGAGYGLPEDRNKDDIEADLRNGLVSKAAARELYNFT